ncbi:MAG: hypothetical protein O2960_05270 [Verrucomicrobia bacterium]|nr:hypothetical protein [Verrucomicrobiota bacterium]
MCLRSKASEAVGKADFRIEQINEASTGLWDGERPVLVYNHRKISNPNAPLVLFTIVLAAKCGPAPVAQVSAPKTSAIVRAAVGGADSVKPKSEVRIPMSLRKASDAVQLVEAGFDDAEKRKFALVSVEWRAADQFNAPIIRLLPQSSIKSPHDPLMLGAYLNEGAPEPQLLFHRIEERSAEAGNPRRVTKDQWCNS